MATNNSINSTFPVDPVSAAKGGTGLASPTIHGILVAEGASPANPIVLTDGQVLIGSTGLDPVAATLTAGTGISIAAAAGSITISQSGSGLVWSTVTGTSQTITENNGYFANNAGLVTFTLPTTAAVGDIIEIGGQGAGGFIIEQNAGQSIRIGNQITTTGVSGSLASTLQGDNIILRCMVANTSFMVFSSYGNFTVV